MMRPEEIQGRLRESPFRPFRFIVGEGLRYEVRHPELVLVGERDLMVGSPGQHHPTIYHRVTRVALIHVVAIEDLPAVPTSGNGEGSPA